jgi:hypothetical protein
MKRYGGSGVPQGTLHKGTKPKPSPTHGGTNLRKGVTKTVSTPASRQPRLATSYHGNK